MTIICWHFYFDMTSDVCMQMFLSLLSYTSSFSVDEVRNSRPLFPKNLAALGNSENNM